MDQSCKPQPKCTEQKPYQKQQPTAECKIEEGNTTHNVKSVQTRRRINMERAAGTAAGEPPENPPLDREPLPHQ
jgi:hypothetical protein